MGGVKLLRTDQGYSLWNISPAELNQWQEEGFSWRRLQQIFPTRRKERQARSSVLADPYPSKMEIDRLGSKVDRLHRTGEAFINSPKCKVTFAYADISSAPLYIQAADRLMTPYHKRFTINNFVTDEIGSERAVFLQAKLDRMNLLKQNSYPLRTKDKALRQVLWTILLDPEAKEASAEPVNYKTLFRRFEDPTTMQIYNALALQYGNDLKSKSISNEKAAKVKLDVEASDLPEAQQKRVSTACAMLLHWQREDSTQVEQADLEYFHDTKLFSRPVEIHQVANLNNESNLAAFYTSVVYPESKVLRPLTTNPILDCVANKKEDISVVEAKLMIMMALGLSVNQSTFQSFASPNGNPINEEQAKFLKETQSVLSKMELASNETNRTRMRRVINQYIRRYDLTKRRQALCDLNGMTEIPRQDLRRIKSSGRIGNPAPREDWQYKDDAR